MKNPWRDISKVSPQVEDGFRRINNDVFRALMQADLSGGEFRVVFAIVGRTWGFDKTSDPLAVSVLASDTGLADRTIRKILSELKRRRIIVAATSEVVVHGAALTRYMPNKYFDTWLPRTPAPQDRGGVQGTPAPQGTEPLPCRAVTTERQQKDDISAKRKKRTPKDSSEHTQAVRFFCEEYEKKLGVRYDFAAGKDGKLLQGLLSTFGLELLQRIIAEFLADDDDWVRDRGYTIAILKTQANKIAARLANGNGSGPNTALMLDGQW